MWNLYKESERGKEFINMFNPDVENVHDSLEKIFKFSNKINGEIITNDSLHELFFLFTTNILNFPNIPTIENGWDRDNFRNFITNLEVKDVTTDEDGTITLLDDEFTLFLPKNKLREKASMMIIISLSLYYFYRGYFPIIYPSYFNIFERNCLALGIEFPPIPRSKDYIQYLLYYFDICTTLNDFQIDNDLSDAEVCACIYDYATLLQEETKSNLDLPSPTNIWFTGASGKGDFNYLDSLGSENKDYHAVWACNERTKRGDIIVMYCTSPRSYIHSIWRANSGGTFNPFDHYHCRATISDGVLIPPISFNDLKADEYFSNVPIVRKRLQGINGVELSPTDYGELLRLVEQKGGNKNDYPSLYRGDRVDFGEIKLENDVEEKILIPFLKKLGYEESDWTRQLSQKAGRGLKAIPDFVFFPKGDKHFASAPMVIEAKYDMSYATERHNAFAQGLSYARMLRSTLMGICDKERLILYKINSNGTTDKDAPIFEDYWDSIYSNTQVGAKLVQIMSKEVVARL